MSQKQTSDDVDDFLIGGPKLVTACYLGGAMHFSRRTRTSEIFGCCGATSGLVTFWVRQALSDSYDCDSVVFPALFNYRPYIELALKASIEEYGDFAGVSIDKRDHDLRTLSCTKREDRVNARRV